jgi:branched-chain amino acid transport system ATP-binding protein
MLEIQDLHAGYGQLSVLHGVDISVGDREIVAVIGANGAGKTTVLRAVSGLLKPSSGRVMLDGKDVAGLGAEKITDAGLAHVPENRLVFPTLSVEDNLQLGAWTRRGDKSGIKERRALALELFPRLSQRLNQPAGTMSGGEQQMLAVARGLMAGPKVVVLDEPSVGLAPRVVSEIFSALSRLRSEQGLAILLIEQNAHAAFKVADRVSVIDRGRIVLEGDPASLLRDDRVKHAYLGGGYSADASDETSDAV